MGAWNVRKYCTVLVHSHLTQTHISKGDRDMPSLREAQWVCNSVQVLGRYSGSDRLLTTLAGLCLNERQNRGAGPRTDALQAASEVLKQLGTKAT